MGGTATNLEDARALAEKIGYPVLLRPSFVLGGRAMMIVYDESALKCYMEKAVEVSENRPVLIDQYLTQAKEVDVDCISDGETTVIGAIMEHVELAGVHSGDSACIIPPPTLQQNVCDEIRQITYRLAKALNVRGLMNIQFAVKDGTVYVLEVNPRASRTVPFVSKAIGVPLAKLASLVMAGYRLEELGFTREVHPRYWAVKEAVLPFQRFPGVDVILSPEMKSTGEVMGIDSTPGMAFLKSQIASGNALPLSGSVFVSVRDQDKKAVVSVAASLVNMGFTIFSTLGTCTALRNNGVKSQPVFKISEGRPNVIDLIEEKNIAWIINTPAAGQTASADEVRMRSYAVAKRIPITTTLDGAAAAVNALETLRKRGRMEVCSLQEYHRHAPRIKLKGLVIEK